SLLGLASRRSQEQRSKLRSTGSASRARAFVEPSLLGLGSRRSQEQRSKLRSTGSAARVRAFVEPLPEALLGTGFCRAELARPGVATKPGAAEQAPLYGALQSLAPRGIGIAAQAAHDQPRDA